MRVQFAADEPVRLNPAAVTRMPVPTLTLANVPDPEPLRLTLSPAKMLPAKTPPARVALAVLSKTLLVTETPLTVMVAGTTRRVMLELPELELRVQPFGEVVLQPLTVMPLKLTLALQSPTAELAVNPDPVNVTVLPAIVSCKNTLAQALALTKPGNAPALTALPVQSVPQTFVNEVMAVEIVGEKAKM